MQLEFFGFEVVFPAFFAVVGMGENLWFLLITWANSRAMAGQPRAQ
jgi:hypothetical protein